MPYMIGKNGKKVELDPITGQPVAETPAAAPVANQGMDVSSPSIFDTAPVEEANAGGFAQNLISSGWNTIKGVGSAALNILNPDMEKNTVANLLRLGIGTGELLVPGEQGAEKYARNVGKFYDERYGISNLIQGDLEGAGKKIGKTIYEDPVGTLLDASIIIGGAGTVVKGVGTVGKIEGLVSAGTKISDLSAGGYLSAHLFLP